MAYHFHQDRTLYFQHQCQNALDYVIPFIETHKPLTQNTQVLEIGCGEGGVLKAFIERGCTGMGVELDDGKFRQAQAFLSEDVEAGNVRLVKKNIHDADFEQIKFDIIILKDVIEHIHDQPKLMRAMQTYLKTDGVIFFGFPPWQMPFGGHQQMCQNKWLARLPWYHTFPNTLYHGLLRLGGESENTVAWLHDTWKTRITLEQFERYAKMTNYKILNRELYLINPIYRFKFGLKPRRQLGLLNIPYLRNWLTTCGYYLLRQSG